MTPIERLKEIEEKATPGPWIEGHHNGKPIRMIVRRGYLNTDPVELDESRANLLIQQHLRNLAHELIALWEAVEKETRGCGLVDYFIPVESIKALLALNVKAKEVLG